MGLNIITAKEPIHIETIITFIYGDPGLGKTSLGFSAKNPILFDFDQGAHRSGHFRKDAVQIKQWSEVANFTAADLADYDTIIIDTVGRCLESIVDFLRSDSKNLRRGSSELSIQGYGKLSSIFKSWLQLLRSMGKDIVLLAHTSEDKDGDNVIKRPDAIGGSKKEMYKVADQMAYLTQERGQNGMERRLNFVPSDSYHAKDSGAIGNVIMTDLDKNPEQLANIIQQAKDHINSLTDAALKTQQELDEFRSNVMDAETPERLNELGKGIGQHVMRPAMLADLKARASHLGYEQTANGFEVAKVEPIPEPADA